MLLTISSRSPLFPNVLPRSQPAREFLSELRKALIYKPKPELPDRVIAASFVNLNTRASTP